MNWEQLLCGTRVREAMKGPSGSSKEATDSRSEFERDYDRAVFSTPVRRLQDKTQVFPLDPHDFIRTRLTHSLEVSTLARGMARRVADALVAKGAIKSEAGRSIESIAATAALIHDLGNPPFGHSGEFAIREWFKGLVDAEKKTIAEGSKPRLAQLTPQEHADFAEFESNAQTLRLVSKLQVLADDFGLNLTLGTLSATMKYTASSDQADAGSNEHERAKPGYFASENDLVKVIRERAGTGEARNPITFLVEAADDLAYATVDFEDGLKKGIATWPEARAELLAEADKQHCAAQVRGQIEASEQYVERATTPLEGGAKGEAIAQILRTKVIGKAVADVCDAFLERHDALLAGDFHDELIKKSGSASVISVFKKVDRKLFYPAKGNLRLELMGRRILKDLLDCFYEGARAYDGAPPNASKFPGKLYHLMSRNYRAVFEKLAAGNPPTEYSKLQLVTDYVCGMTDSFACSLHRQLTNG